MEFKKQSTKNSYQSDINESLSVLFDVTTSENEIVKAVSGRVFKGTAIVANFSSDSQNLNHWLNISKGALLSKEERTLIAGCVIEGLETILSE